jgi:hypothetical protein
MEMTEDTLRALTAKCEAAKLIFQDSRDWANRFTALVFTMAAAVVGTLIAALVLLFVSDSKAGAVGAGAGTLATGTAMGFVIKQLQRFLRRADAARRVLKEDCGENL